MVRHLHPFRAAWSHSCRINDRDGKSLEIIGVEGESSRDAMGLHGGGEAGVVRLEALDTIRLNESVPTVNQICTVVEEREPPLKVMQPLARLPRIHTQAVLPGGRWAGRARCHRPEFVKVLRNDN